MEKPISNVNPYQSTYGGEPLSMKPREKEPVLAAHKWLLLGALAVGIACQFAWLNIFGEGAAFAAWYTALWGVYGIVFHIICWQRIRERPLAMPFAAAAAILLVMLNLQMHGYSDDMLIFLNMLVVPALLMLHAQAVMHPVPPQGEGAYFPLFFRGFFVQPFVSMPRCFSAIGALFKPTGKSRAVWIGALIALPIVIIVLSLLLSADAVMRYAANSLFENIRLGEFLMRAFWILLFSLLFYSFLYGAAFAKQTAAKPLTLPVWQPAAPRIVVGALLLVYLLFIGVQFVYLFGGAGLPADLTYSEYAREGFNQLIWVAAINLAVFAVCICRVEQDKLLRYLLLALLVATGGILASAFTRLGLYIQAYDFKLTFRRIQAFWMLSYITFILVLCIIRLHKQKLPLLRWSMLVLVGWYVILNLPDLKMWY